MSLKSFISKKGLGLYFCDKSFKEITSMKVGGKIKLLYYPSTVNNLCEVIRYMKKRKSKYLIIGNGTNIIASDRVYKHPVISGKHLIKGIEYFSDYFIVSAFMDLRLVLSKIASNQISSLVGLAGIPATVGGAIVMNASAYNMAISDNLLWVKYFDGKNIVVKKKDDIKFSYRNSEFKNSDIIILEAAFKITYDINTLFTYKNLVNERKLKQPLNYPNSGSIFCNLKDIKAYQVIIDLDLVNKKIGGAKFSEKHANFIVNVDNAKGIDVYKLIKLAKQKALKNKKIILKEEVILVNF